MFRFGFVDALVFVALGVNATCGLVFGTMLRPWFWPRLIRKGETGFAAGIVVQFLIAAAMIAFSVIQGV